MRYTTKERWEQITRAEHCGLSRADAIALRRIGLTLHRWFELECGTDHGAIERDGQTGKPYWMAQPSHGKPYRYPVPDRERGAYKRLAQLMERYPLLRAYVQTDPRGGTIYLCRPEDANDQAYSRGVLIV